MTKETWMVEAENCDVYRGQNRVLKSLSLRIKEGERIAVLGPNGAGKTTLVKLLTRELYPKVAHGSSLKLFGEAEISLSRLRDNIGYVSHESQADYRTLATGREVLLSAFYGSVGVHQHQKFSEEQQQRVSEILRERGLTDLAEQRFLQLSSGQQRRLLLARANIHRPQMMILDEPTNGLDIAAALQIMRELRHLAHGIRTLLLISHHLQEIVPEFERIVILKQGKVFADGKKEELLTSEVLSEVFETPLKVTSIDGFYQCQPDD